MASTNSRRNRIIGVYVIRNLVNGKVYVGSSKDILCRFNGHKACLRRNAHANKFLQRKRMSESIKRALAEKKMNIINSGQAVVRRKWSEETKAKMPRSAKDSWAKRGRLSKLSETTNVNL